MDSLVGSRIYLRVIPYPVIFFFFFWGGAGVPNRSSSVQQILTIKPGHPKKRSRVMALELGWSAPRVCRPSGVAFRAANACLGFGNLWPMQSCAT